MLVIILNHAFELTRIWHDRVMHVSPSVFCNLCEAKGGITPTIA